MAPGHVPAWRKLGLKLKGSNNVSDTTELDVPAVSDRTAFKNSKRKKHSDFEEPDKRLNKREKKSKRGKVVRGESSGTPQVGGINGVSELPTRYSTPPQTSRKRKSVSFTPDTKAKDGGTNPESLIRTLDSNKLVLEAPDQAGEETLYSSNSTTSDEPKVKQSKKKRKGKKSKSTLLATQSDADPTSNTKTSAEITYTPPHLEYLTQFHTSRSTWKFNKTRQTHLLKHVLNIEDIPLAYDEALRDYVISMQGQQALERLHSQANEAVEADDIELSKADAMESSQPCPSESEKAKKKRKVSESDSVSEPSPEANRRAEYKQALARAKRKIHIGELAREEHELIQDPEWQKRFYRRKRAEMTIWATSNNKWKARPLHPEVGTVEVVEEKVKQNGIEVTKRKRKRKRRTGIPDDDTSSSESSSGGSNGSDSDSDASLKAAETALVNALGSGQSSGKVNGSNTGADDKVDETSSSGGSDDDDTSSDDSDD